MSGIINMDKMTDMRRRLPSSLLKFPSEIKPCKIHDSACMMQYGAYMVNESKRTGKEKNKCKNSLCVLYKPV